MLNRILFVDDEPNVLQAFERQFRNRFMLRTALGPEEGLQLIAGDEPFAVVVSDLRMPGMDGIEFLSRVRKLAPDTVRLMLSGNADFRSALAAVNEGRIWQLLTKPCPSDALGRALDAAIDQYRLITAERELLEQTLRGSISVLVEILALVNPPAFSRAQRMCRYIRHAGAKLQLAGQWQYEVAALLSQIACVTIPPETMAKVERSQPLTPAEEEILESQARLSQDLLAKIPRLDVVAKMVANQAQPWIPGSSDPAVIGANLLSIASEFDEGIFRGELPDAIIARMRRRKSYNSEFVQAFELVQIETDQYEQRQLHLNQLRTGMVVSADVRTRTGLLLLAKGQEVTDSVVARLRSFSRTVGICEPICVSIPTPITSQISAS